MDVIHFVDQIKCIYLLTVMYRQRMLRALHAFFHLIFTATYDVGIICPFLKETKAQGAQITSQG